MLLGIECLLVVKRERVEDDVSTRRSFDKYKTLTIIIIISAVTELLRSNNIDDIIAETKAVANITMV